MPQLKFRSPDPLYLCTPCLTCCTSTTPHVQLNLGVTGTALPNNTFGQGSGSRRLQSINCVGSEATWEGCRSAVFSSTACNAKGDVAIRCSGAARELSSKAAGGDMACTHQP